MSNDIAAWRPVMLAQTRQQQKAAATALDAKRGRLDPAGLRGPSRDLYDHLTERELAELAWPLAS